MEESTIKSLEAIGSLWPLILTIAGILLIVFLIIVIFKNRKAASALLSRLSQFRVKYNNTEIDLVSAEGIMDQNAHRGVANVKDNEETVFAEEENIKSVSESTEGDEDENLWLQLFLAIKDHEDYASAQSIYEEIINQEQDTDKRKEYFYIYHGYLATKGVEGAINKIKKQIEKEADPNIQAYGLWQIATVYKGTGSYDLSEEYLKKGIELGATQYLYELKLSLFEVYSLSEQHDKAIKENIELIRELKEENLESDNELIVQCLRQLATSYQRNGQNFHEALYEILILKYLPYGKQHLFNAAFDFSNLSFHRISAYLYQRSLNVSKNNSRVLNNLGAEFNSLDLPMNAVINYKLAAEKGYHWSIGNLAHRYIEAGFYEDAKDLLSIPILQDSKEERVVRAKARLDTALSRETEEIERVMKTGKTAYSHFQAVAETIMNRDKPNSYFTATWYHAGFDKEVIISILESNNVVIKWKKSDELEDIIELFRGTVPGIAVWKKSEKIKDHILPMFSKDAPHEKIIHSDINGYYILEDKKIKFFRLEKDTEEIADIIVFKMK